MDFRTFSNGDRREARGPLYSRRKTVSGALPRLQRIPGDESAPNDTRPFQWSSPSAPTSPVTAVSKDSTGLRPISHRRSTSGNIFARLGFLRSSGDDGPPSPAKERPATKDQGLKNPTRNLFSRKSIDDEPHLEPPESPTKAQHPMAAALKASGTRKRKSSLRKTALLGTRRIMFDSKERKPSFGLLSRPQQNKSQEMLEREEEEEEEEEGEAELDDNAPVADDPRNPSDGAQELPEHDQSLPNILTPHSLERASTAANGDGVRPEARAVAVAKLALITNQKAQMQRLIGSHIGSNDLGSPLDVKSPTSRTSYASTTDDDELLTFNRPSKSYTSQSSIASSLLTPQTSSVASYFPPLPESSIAMRQRRVAKRSSPLSHSIPPSSYTEPEPHDCTETEYWGWVILFVTWVTFTVGMGSCLEVWSWAWDVGQTPEAPLELSNDDSLPIVGYYPALMVLTGVVAWIWITVAWVGMKYFRHAKIEV